MAHRREPFCGLKNPTVVFTLPLMQNALSDALE
jgi:hypothetical protein